MVMGSHPDVAGAASGRDLCSASAAGVRDRVIARRIRTVAEEIEKPVAILQDLPGPKIRLGIFKDGSVELHAGDRFCLTADEVPGDCSRASVSYSKLPEEVSRGQSILLADGTVELEVESVTPPNIVCRVVLGGTLQATKGYPS